MKNYRKLTKKQRNKCYINALDRIKQGSDTFVCNILGHQKSGWFMSNDEMLINFPEFMSKKPKRIRVPIYEGGWWAMNNKNIRIRVLNQCIKETLPKSKTNK